MAARTAITPTREQDYSEWYQQVVRAADLAENSAVRGCMVIKPWGYQLWENMRAALDRMFKATGHVERLLPALHSPLLLPEGSRARQGVRQGVRGRHAPPAGAGPRRQARAGLATGRAPRRAADQRDHHRRDLRPMGAELSRPAPAHQPVGQRRPLGDAHRACSCGPTEFLWQEGHTAHETEAEAREETMRILEIYRDVRRGATWPCPVLTGEKTAAERFPGRRRDLLHRGPDAGPQGAAGGHQPLPRDRTSRRPRGSASSRAKARRSTPGPRAGACPRA